jgi:hypothetical protein
LRYWINDDPTVSRVDIDAAVSIADAADEARYPGAAKPFGT